MHELKITMLGPSGVGKTSLLTAMYEQFESNIGKTNLQLTPDEESSAILQERLIELKTLLDSFESTGGLEGTEGEPEDLKFFVFGLGKKGEKPSVQIKFQDYPGGYHAAKATPEKRQFVKSLMTECVAILITVDAPALMEQNGKWHDFFNRPQQITDLFKIAYENLDSPRLVIFAPVKCEKYLQDETSTKELLQRLQEGYTNLLDLFNSSALLSKVAVVVTPVQTVGSIVFSRIEMNSNAPHFHFRKTNHFAEYNPRDSEQPLRYLLRFLLKLHLDQRSQGFLGLLRNLFRRDSHFKVAVNQFAVGCKTNNGFAMLQGEDLLKVN